MAWSPRIVHSPIIGTSSFRHTFKLPPPLYSRSPGGEFSATPVLWHSRSVFRVSRIRASAESRQGNGDEENRLPQASTANWTELLAKFAANNFLPLALVSGVSFGLANPTLGCLADTYYISKLSTFGIFIISGLTLRSDEIGAAAEAWPVGLFGLLRFYLSLPYSQESFYCSSSSHKNLLQVTLRGFPLDESVSLGSLGSSASVMYLLMTCYI
ncbi:hypothetical protein CASFOL_006343 [Castilleja foliolosa]|uniref:Uncharacterized protein n=1 Tax=Castilleja foliolosa TaxID=1961234 RepID=A0ABD3E639_9LAMI